MGSTPQARGQRHRAVPRCTGPTWEADRRLRRSPAPVISEQHQHGLLALVVVLARCKLQRGGLEQAPSQTLDRHQQTLVTAFIFSPITNLGNQTGVTTVLPARTGTAVESPWQAPGPASSGVAPTRNPRGHTLSPSPRSAPAAQEGPELLQGCDTGDMAAGAGTSVTCRAVVLGRMEQPPGALAGL